MNIKEIAFVCYPVISIKRARKFYEGILGLKPTHQWIKDDLGMIEYDIAGGTLAIGAGAPHFTPGKHGPCVALEVADFDDTITTLKKKKVTFLMDAYESPVCSMALVEDPDGNQIMIHKRKKQ